MAANEQRQETPVVVSYHRRHDGASCLRRLLQRFRQPAGSSDFALCKRGEFRLLELLPRGRWRLLARFMQSFEHLMLAHTAEIVVGGRREPPGHVETECCRKLSGVNQSRAVRAVGFHLHGVNGAGGAESQEVKEDGLILL